MVLDGFWWTGIPLNRYTPIFRRKTSIPHARNGIPHLPKNDDRDHFRMFFLCFSAPQAKKMQNILLYLIVNRDFSLELSYTWFFEGYTLFRKGIPPPLNRYTPLPVYPLFRAKNRYTPPRGIPVIPVYPEPCPEENTVVTYVFQNQMQVVRTGGIVNPTRVIET